MYVIIYSYTYKKLASCSNGQRSASDAKYAHRTMRSNISSYFLGVERFGDGKLRRTDSRRQTTTTTTTTTYDGDTYTQTHRHSFGGPSDVTAEEYAAEPMHLRGFAIGSASMHMYAHTSPLCWQSLCCRVEFIVQPSVRRVIHASAQCW